MGNLRIQELDPRCPSSRGSGTRSSRSARSTCWESRSRQGRSLQTRAELHLHHVFPTAQIFSKGCAARSSASHAAESERRPRSSRGGHPTVET
eukprot:5466188-Prymnesium_polylepis.1